MTKEEAIAVIRKNYPHVGFSGTEFETALRELIPELAESEDERTRSALLRGFNSMLANQPIGTFYGEPIKDIIAYLERKKEPAEELSTRLNGVMQEYVKSGKDEEEQEHRLKCYQLFWDALEDSEFFEQKEPIMPEDTVIFQKGVAEGRRLEREDMEKERLPIIETYQRSWYTEGYYDGKLKKEPRWIIKTQGICTKYEKNPKYGQSLEEEQRPLPGFDDLTPDEKMNHPLYLEGFDVGREVGRVEAEQKPELFNEPFNPDDYETVMVGDATGLKRKEQKQAKFNDNDDQLIGFIFDLLNDLVWRKDWAMSKEECLERLKSLRSQPKQEWGEEDEKLLNKVEALLDDYCDFLEDESSRFIPEVRETISRLKSLRPKPHWKPSEEQMEAFRSYIKDFQEKAEAAVGGWNNFDAMIQLFEQLKKLL